MQPLLDGVQGVAPLQRGLGRRQGFLIGCPECHTRLRRLVFPAANERRQLGLIVAGRDAKEIDDRYSVVERLANLSVIGRLRLDTDQPD